MYRSHRPFCSGGRTPFRGGPFAAHPGGRIPSFSAPYSLFNLRGEGTLNRRGVAAMIGEIMGRTIEARRGDEEMLKQFPDILWPMFAHYDRHGLRGNALTLRTILGREPRNQACRVLGWGASVVLSDPSLDSDPTCTGSFHVFCSCFLVFAQPPGAGRAG